MYQTTITIIGNVAAPPERHQSGTGPAVTRLRIASSPRRFDRDSARWIDGPTSWYSVSAFRSLGDNAFASLSKGDRVVLTGRLKIRSWESGDKRGTDAEIEADAIGHDLLWGTSTFERANASAATSSEPKDGWHVPAEGGAEEGSAADASDDPVVDWPTATPAEAKVEELADAPF